MLKEIFLDFVGMIYPEYCQACQGDLERGEELVCTKCRFSLPKIPAYTEPNQDIARRFWGKVPVAYTLAYLKFIKHGKVQELLHNLKYHNKPQIGELFGRWYGTELVTNGFEKVFDLVIPVPLHPTKLRKRGYNQSDGIAKGISEGLQTAWSSEVIHRTVFTETQTRKRRYERYENVAAVFDIPNPEKVQDKHILIVDDVLTTGSTFEACVQLILDKGAKQVSIFALAATV
jgi:ComF family protein